MLTAPHGYRWEFDGYGWILVPEIPYAPIPPEIPAAPPGWHWYLGYGTAYLVPNITPPSLPDPPYGYTWEPWGSGYILLPYADYGFPQAPSSRPEAPPGMYWAQNGDGFWGLFPQPVPEQPQVPSQPGQGDTPSAPGEQPAPEDDPSLPGIPGVPGIVPEIPPIVPVPVLPPVVPVAEGYPPTSDSGLPHNGEMPYGAADQPGGGDGPREI
ncbi:hypothetical protein IU501_25820 [Nocardia otitidiscaviarum]|uniref:hypothetical protein n=1 Tax=Nocardia otitidiscaviarum TaxID=1823 RepID=UPI0011DDE20D|nr:hypothetical protein [Nocardia otitidiscaviarum]MBF6136406.1 hypothetical protein [Nocardia otitidiscaviarum]MBF6484608.1 hypothetical protein [Nocardia otitidiscaviarum]